jgi:hypothetical protein
VEDDELSLSENPPELDALAGILAGHPFEVFDECFLAVRDRRIVLGVRRSNVSANGFRRL